MRKDSTTQTTKFMIQFFNEMKIEINQVPSLKTT
jgi:hypothetical protein